MTDAEDDTPWDEERLERAEDLLAEAGEFLERAGARRDVADTRDLGEAIARAREGLPLAGGDADLELELRAVLADALMQRAQARLLEAAARDTAPRGAVRADLDEAIGHVEWLLATAPAGHPEATPLLVDLTLACLWRVQADDEGRPEPADRMVEHARQAWRLLDPEHPDRPMVGHCLASGLYEQMYRPRPEFPARLVDDMIGVLSEITPRFDDGSDERLLAEMMLASGLVGRGQENESRADFAAARPFALSAAAALRNGNPAHANTAKELAKVIAILADSGLLFDHLDLAVDTLRAAVANPVGDPAQDAVTRSSLAGVLRIRAFRSGRRDLRDSPDVREAIELLRVSYDLAPPGSAERLIAAWDVGSALLTRYFQTGVREDLDAARFYLEPFRDTGAAGPSRVLRGRVVYLDALVPYTMAQVSLARGINGDLAAFDEAIDGFRTALGRWPQWHPFAAQTRNELATARLLRAARADSPDIETLREAAREMRAATGTVTAGEAMSPPVTSLQASGALTMAGFAAQDPALLLEAIARLSRARDQVDPDYGERTRFTAMLGYTSARLYEMTGSADDLRNAAAWLEEADAELDRHPGHPRHGDVLSALARLRHISGGGRQAIEAGLALLRVRVRDVLLQTGTQRGLASARAAAADGLRVARWSLDAGLPDQAVAALELGRGLVLHSATSVAELPELLAARGHDDLAREWRAEAGEPWDSAASEPGDAGGGAEALSALLEADGLVVPGDLRERTLDALADVAAGRLLAAPGPAEIGAALARAGADALVYLLLADGGQSADGGQVVRALLVPAGDGGQTRELPLPGLPVGTVLDDCAAAHAGLLAASPQDETDHASEQLTAALGQACAWAGTAVIDPLLEAVPSGLPQLVLVPTGSLSLVPWHAARCADDGGWTHACARAVFTYAASGRQYAEVSRRPKLPPGQSPVIVADPTSTLPGAKAEAEAIRDNFYPQARYFGPGTGTDGRGEPGDVLAVLPSATDAGASVLHVAGHANVEAGSPDRSYLVLADGQPLTVSEILRQAAGRDPAAAGGLVCLAACRTDLAAGDYDEALTLATAFLAGGAVGVVGARWEIPDLPSSALMFMFHYFLVKRGLPQGEALRQAQLWMLDPQRPVPDDADMPGEMAAHAGFSAFAELTAWAGIAHQGQ